MTVDLTAVWAGPARVLPERLVAAGLWLPYPDSGPHPALGGVPVCYVSAPLWQALQPMAAGLDPRAARSDPTAAACDVLRLLAASAAAADGAFHRTPRVAELGRRPVHFRRVPGPDGPVVALFPNDPALRPATGG